MTKKELQKELLEKVKPGTKPSDIKKNTRKQNKTSISPSPISIDKDYESDEGYESDSSDKSIPTAPPLPNQQIKDLQTQITSLQKQLQTYKDFKQADLKNQRKTKKRNRTMKGSSQKVQYSNCW